MGNHKINWTARSTNVKTGDIPTAWVGDKIEETRESCKGCPLLAERTCYAHIGSPRIGITAVFKASAKDPEGYTIKGALAKAHKRARFVRMTGLGDLARCERTSVLADMKYARGKGFGVLAYTHFWREEPRTGGLKRDVMASCNNPAEADEAREAGWIPAAIVPEAPADGGAFYVTPGGARLIVCPAQRRKGDVTCNACGLCDRHSPAWKSGKVDGVAFIPHGIGEKRLTQSVKAASGKRLPLA